MSRCGARLGRLSSQVQVPALFAALVMTAGVGGTAPDATARPTRDPTLTTEPDSSVPPPNPWARVQRPSSGPPRAVGGYSAGCLDGGARLPPRGKGFLVAEPERRRYFGHPALVDFIRRLGAKVNARGLGVLPIGDMSQPRGGPAPSGHASHQTGLDADIWYVDGRGSSRVRKVAMVDIDRQQPTARFTSRIGRVLALAAGDPAVDRIFVNPVIKRELCASAGKERRWLHKLRPWWLHHEHFHVRMSCPADSPECKAQDPIPEGDGCGELKWWLQPRAEPERSEKRKQYRSKLGSVPILPARCAALVASPHPAVR